MALSQQDLRRWAGSLSPSWQAVVPGVFAWGVTVLPAALGAPTSLPLALAALALLMLFLGPVFERGAADTRARLTSFWGFVLLSLGALGTSGVPTPFERTEALIGVLSWVVFALTVAAPALGPEARGLHSRVDPTLAPRKSVSRLPWLAFAIAVVCASFGFAMALSEPSRDRATMLSLLAALSAVTAFAAVGNQVHRSSKRPRWFLSWSGVLLSLLLLGLAVALLSPQLRPTPEPTQPAPSASG